VSNGDNVLMSGRLKNLKDRDNGSKSVCSKTALIHLPLLLSRGLIIKGNIVNLLAVN